MKSINKILIGIFISMTVQFVHAQNKLNFGSAQNKPNLYSDTLTLTTGAQVDVKFMFYRMSDKEVYMTDDLWNSILNIMTTAVESSEYDGGVEVTYSKLKKEGEEEVAKVEVKKIKGNSDVFLIGTEGMKEVLSNRTEFKILLPKVAIAFFVNTLDELEAIGELSVESVWDQVNLKYENYGKRNIYKGKGVFKYGKANISGITGKPGGTDSIEISMGVGMGFYRDRFVPDLGIKLGFNFPDRYGNTKIQTGLLYTQQVMFSGSEISTSEPDVNGFLSGFFSLKYGNGNEIGLGLGYLIRSDGDFYSGNTFKMSVFSQRTGSKISFTPELVFTNDFKQAFPALRFGLSF